MNGDHALLGAVDPHPHGAKSGDRSQGILALEEAADPGNAPRQRPQHDGAVRNGFIPRYPRFTGDITTRL